jgi:hypothetical protein
MPRWLTRQSPKLAGGIEAMNDLGISKSALPCIVTRDTKSVMDFLVAPSFKEGNASVCENAKTGKCRQ